MASWRLEGTSRQAPVEQAAELIILQTSIFGSAAASG
jgi:hypothetical protein